MKNFPTILYNLVHGPIANGRICNVPIENLTICTVSKVQYEIAVTFIRLSYIFKDVFIGFQ